ncbi:MAG: hypothetical protein O7B26_01220 [Planctomycetota bacterium]|nr:hypothetical protein [Planctomycetota bacterium]
MARAAGLVFVIGTALGTAQTIGVWETRAPLPIRATEVSAAVIDGNVYVVCGILPDFTRNNRLYIYDPRQDRWSEGSPMPVSGDHCNVAAAGGKLYVLSGLGFGDRFGDTLSYDPGEDRWETVGRMEVARGASGVAAIGTKIYVAGGQGSPQAATAFEVFDTEARTWTRLPDLPTSRNHLTAQAVDGKFYAIGGRSPGVLTANEEYDPMTNGWTARAPLPTARAGLGSGVIGGRIQVIGGEGPSGTPESTYEQNEEYDPATDTWTILTPMPTPRHGFYGATVADGDEWGRLFAPGGGPEAGATFSAVHEAFFLPPPEPPLFPMEGVVNAASFLPEIAPGGITSIFGVGLSFGSQTATALPLPTTMNAVTVRVNGVPAPLFFVSSGQINFLMDFLGAGEVDVVVSNAGVDSAPIRVRLVPAAPAIFTLTQGDPGQGAVLIAGTNLVAGNLPGLPSRPARPGEVIAIFATGFGFIEGALARTPAGKGAAERPEIAPGVSIGGRPADLLFSGPAPGFSGLDQVNARVPEDAPVGDEVRLTISLGEPVSNTVTIAISAGK